MKKLYGRLIEWLGTSNRWKHLAGGFVLGFAPSDPLAGLYGGITAASALEYKDRAYGGRWDWTDWWLTTGGAAAGCLLRYYL